MEHPKAPPEMPRPRGAEITGRVVRWFSTMDRARRCSLEGGSWWQCPNLLGRQTRAGGGVRGNLVLWALFPPFEMWPRLLLPLGPLFTTEWGDGLQAPHSEPWGLHCLHHEAFSSSEAGLARVGGLLACRCWKYTTSGPAAWLWSPSVSDLLIVFVPIPHHPLLSCSVQPGVVGGASFCGGCCPVGLSWGPCPEVRLE